MGILKQPTDFSLVNPNRDKKKKIVTFDLRKVYKVKRSSKARSRFKLFKELEVLPYTLKLNHASLQQ